MQSTKRQVSFLSIIADKQSRNLSRSIYLSHFGFFSGQTINFGICLGFFETNAFPCACLYARPAACAYEEYASYT